MTDAEIKRKKAICEVAGVKEIDDVSDGFHTFKQLYYQRMMLFAALVKQNRDKAWKSLRHEDGELCFGGGWFVVGIDTPEGSYTYHYEDKYFDLFDCVELERGKHWDGHTEKDVTRLLSLEQEPYDDCISRQAALEKAINVPIAKVVTEDEVIYRKIIFADDIEKLPSVTLQSKTGHWIFRDFIWWKCSECGQVIYSETEKDRREYHAFCGRCGAKMIEQQESEVNK